jgi:nucleoside-diphosphate-sugar epimerase
LEKESLSLLKSIIMSVKNVVLVGANGDLGARVLTALRESFTVTALTRKSSKHTFPSDVKVVSISDDYPRDELVAAFKGQDAVVSTVSGHGIDAQKTLVDAAVEAGIKRIIPSEFGCDTRDPDIQPLVPAIFTPKVAVLDYIISKESQGLTWTGIATSVFFDWSFQKTNGALLKLDLKNKTALVLDDGNARFSVSNLDTIGQAVKLALEKPEASKNKYLCIHSFVTSQNELIAAVEKETGIKLEKNFVDGQKYLKESSEKTKQGDTQALFGALFGTIVLKENFTKKASFGNPVLGLPEQTLAESIGPALKDVQI